MEKKRLQDTAEDLFDIFRLFYKNVITPISSCTYENMTRSHFEALFALDDLGQISMSEMAKKLILSKSYTTALVDKLVKEGFVERIPNKRDRRMIYIDITDKGRNFLEEHKKAVEENIESRINYLEEEQLYRLRVSAKEMKDIICKIYLKDENKKGEIK